MNEWTGVVSRPFRTVGQGKAGGQQGSYGLAGQINVIALRNGARPGKKMNT